jgi:RHH-type transcriptional regulator, rel operon repressor / antitoxin RelB
VLVVQPNANDRANVLAVLPEADNAVIQALREETFEVIRQGVLQRNALSCLRAPMYFRLAFYTRINTMYTFVLYEEQLMESAVLTLRVDSKTKSKLDKLAEATKRSKSFLAAEAIERYLEVEAWQIKEIKQATKEADAGDFVSDAEFAKIVKKYAG